ncbi:hypothetical protein KR074_003511, partial [Drosophila pseudoananassae]
VAYKKAISTIHHSSQFLTMHSKNTAFLTVFSLISLATAVEFVQLGNKSYYFETKEYKNWFDAAQSCHKLNADLISFETYLEWHYINFYLWTNYIDDVYWTSGTDLAEQGKHRWFATGNPIDQDIWYPGEPNNLGGDEHCDEIGSKREIVKSHSLNDNNCKIPRRYICE